MLSKEQAERLVSENIGSLEDLCKQAICTADLNLMLAIGFPEYVSHKLRKAIVEKASELGIEDLEEHYEKSLNGASNIINTIIRKFHPLYFASRANLHPIYLLQHIKRNTKNDICAIMFEYSIGRADTILEKRRRVLEQRAEESRKKVETFSSQHNLDEQGE